MVVEVIPWLAVEKVCQVADCEDKSSVQTLETRI